MLVVDNDQNLECEIKLRSIIRLVKAENTNLLVVMTEYKMHVLVSKSALRLKQEILNRIKEMGKDDIEVQEISTKDKI